MCAYVYVCMCVYVCVYMYIYVCVCLCVCASEFTENAHLDGLVVGSSDDALVVCLQIPVATCMHHSIQCREHSFDATAVSV